MFDLLISFKYSHPSASTQLAVDTFIVTDDAGSRAAHSEPHERPRLMLRPDGAAAAARAAGRRPLTLELCPNTREGSIRAQNLIRARPALERSEIMFDV